MAALCAVVLLAYINAFSAGFVFDDRGILLQDPRIRAVTAENLALILQHTYWWPFGESGLYRPFTTLTYLFNYAILGNAQSPAGYHWINVLLHAGNVLLVFAVLRRLLRGFWTSFWGAALWAVHPVLTEPVSTIVGRADLLACMAVLGGFLMYLKSADSTGARRWGWLAGLFAVTLAGVFSKESAAIIPGVIVLYELTWWKDRRRGRELLLGCVAAGLALAIMAAARFAVFRPLPPTLFPYVDNPLIDAGFWTARLTAVKVMAKYLGLLVWPARLSCDYSYAQITLASGSAGDWLAWLSVAAAVAAAVWSYRRNRAVFFLCAVAFLALLPTSNLLFPIGTIMAERFLYVPAIAAAALAACGFHAAAERVNRPRLAPVALAVLLAACLGRTWARTADWHDNVSLMKAAVATSPGSYKTHTTLAAALFEADASHSNIDAVIAEAEKGLAILAPVPDSRTSASPYRSAGGYYVAKGDLLMTRGADGSLTVSPEGRRAYRRALELLLHTRSIVKASVEWEASMRRPGEPPPQPDAVKTANLERAISATALRLDEPARAVEAANNAQRLEPGNPENYIELAGAYAGADRPDDAAIALAEGSLITSDPSLREALLDLYRQGLDSNNCAITAGPYGPAINPSCGIVRRHLCAAAAQATELYKRTRRPDLAEQMSSQAGQLGCR